MSKLPRRKKAVTVDGADYVISALSYKELTTYGEMEEAFNKNKGTTAEFSLAQYAELKGMTLFAICSSLNGADPKLGLTPEEANTDIDDILAGRLWREIMTFNGIAVPSEEEVKKQIEERRRSGKPPAGETQASS